MRIKGKSPQCWAELAVKVDSRVADSLNGEFLKLVSIRPLPLLFYCPEYCF